MSTYNRAHITIISLVAVVIYSISAYQAAAPLSLIEDFCLVSGMIATFVAFWNYFLLVEKFFNGKVTLVGGRFAPVEPK